LQIIQSFFLALKSILSNKMRSFLTMLGIIIGVAAVIILVGIVNGEMSYMQESFASLGTNRITVNLINLNTRSVDVDQMYEFYEENADYFDHMSPTVTVSATVKYGSDNMDSTTVTGVSEDYLDILGESLESGRFIQYADIASRQKICVIGLYTAQELFGSAQSAVGKELSVNGEKYSVVGVIERQTSESDDMEEGGDDDVVYLPYTAAVKLSRNGVINSYIFTERDTSQTETVKQLIEDFLYPIFQNTDLYHITAMSEMLDSMNSMIATMSLMLGGIAGISLLVAGVGVMNIMLVSVTERTREIGVRKALGARRGTIMQQFVIEAAVTSSLGGLIGIGVGFIGTRIAGALMGINAYPTAVSVAVSFCVSVGIGLIFGYAPASRAAKLNPIDALRSE
jgi:putative ABC transport system permease protein